MIDNNINANRIKFDEPFDDQCAAFREQHFEILDFESTDGINMIPEMRLTVSLPDNVAKLNSLNNKDYVKFKDSFEYQSYDSAENFLLDQMYKRVSVCFERPYPEHVPTNLFEKTTHFSGIVSNISILPPSKGLKSHIQVIIRPPLWLLTLQNGFRSFEDKTVQEILEAIFAPYKDALSEEKFVIEFQIQGDIPKRVQVIQNGETDFEFLQRLMQEDALSYFFYYTEEEGCTCVITNSLFHSFEKIEKKFFKSDDESTITLFAQNAQALEQFDQQVFESQKLVLENYEVTLRPHISSEGFYLNDYRKNNSVKPSTPDDVQAKLSISKVFQPKVQLPLSTTQYFKADETEKPLNNLLNKASISDFYTHSYTLQGRVRLFGFWPIWRHFLFSLKQRNSDETSSLYKSNLLDFSETNNQFYIWRMKSSLQHLSHHLNKSFDRHNTNNTPSEIHLLYCQIDFSFSTSLSDNSSTDPETSFYVRHEKSLQTNPFTIEKKRTFLAQVVDFQTDKKQKDFEIPNTIRVQFPWNKKESESDDNQDKSRESESSSVKARLSTFWASKGLGSAFLPKVGDEVLVTLADDMPDYPIVMSSLYNSENNFPLKVAEGKKYSALSEYGIVFQLDKSDDKEETSSFLFNYDGEKKASYITCSTTHGTINALAPNINFEAETSYDLSVAKDDKKTTLKVDEDGFALNVLDKSDLLTLKKDKIAMETKEVSVEAKSAISLDAKSKLEGKAPAIDFKASGKFTANSLTAPG